VLVFGVWLLSVVVKTDLAAAFGCDHEKLRGAKTKGREP
jgi:hypothetical protein